MQDPFADKSNNRFHREVQMWMTVLMCLLVTFLYLVVKRVGGSDNEIPAHILQADVTHYERALVSPPKPSQLSSAPPIRSGSFATNVNPAPKPIAKSNLIAKSNFGFANQPNPSKLSSTFGLHDETYCSICLQTDLAQQHRPWRFWVLN